MSFLKQKKNLTKTKAQICVCGVCVCMKLFFIIITGM